MMTGAATFLLGALAGVIRPVLHKTLNRQALAEREKNPSGQTIESGNFPA